MSAESANRDLEARLSTANEDKRAAETRLAGPHHGKGPPCRQVENPGARLGDGAQIHVKFVRNWYEIRTKFVRISQNLEYSHTFIHVKFVRISYEFRTNFT